MTSSDLLQAVDYHRHHSREVGWRYEELEDSGLRQGHRLSGEGCRVWSVVAMAIMRGCEGIVRS